MEEMMAEEYNGKTKDNIDFDDFSFVEFPLECDDESCGCPCYDYCKDRMYGVDHFSCEDVYNDYLKNKGEK